MVIGSIVISAMSWYGGDTCKQHQVEKQRFEMSREGDAYVNLSLGRVKAQR